METKVRITYQHPVREDDELEVVGFVYNTDETTTYVKRIDGYSIDIPNDKILTNEPVPKQ